MTEPVEELMATILRQQQEIERLREGLADLAISHGRERTYCVWCGLIPDATSHPEPDCPVSANVPRTVLERFKNPEDARPEDFEAPRADAGASSIRKDGDDSGRAALAPPEEGA